MTNFFFSERKFHVFHTTLCCGKTRNSLSLKTFRQINYLVTLLVKLLLSRNFSKKQWEKNFVISTLCCGDYCGNLLSRFLGKNFVKPEWFYKRSDYWGVLTTFFLGESKYFILPHHLHSVEKREIHCHANFFPSNQVIVKFCSKTLIWRNFCEKKMTVFFRQINLQ